MDEANTYLKRINELAAKAKTAGLTEAEIKERDELRQAYLREFRKAFGNILDNTSIQYPDGTKVPLKKK